MNKQNTIEGVYEGILDSVRRVDNFTKPEPQAREQVVYKLKHIPTGLYFEPMGYKGNVSEIGKVYSNKKPPRQNFISVPNEIKDKYPINYYETEHSDWEVVEYKLVKLNKGE